MKKISPFPSGLSEAQTCTVHRAEGGAGIDAARIDMVEKSAQELSVADISDDVGTTLTVGVSDSGSRMVVRAPKATAAP